MRDRVRTVFAIYPLAFVLGFPALTVPPFPQDQHKDAQATVDAIGKRSVGKGLNLYSLEKEKELGQKLAEEVARSAKLLNDPVVNDYLNGIAQNLTRNFDARVPIVIRVIDSDVPEVMALRAGFLFINTGLILRAEGEAELAGALTHAIAHVALRHSTKEATKGEIMQLATFPLLLLGPSGWAGCGTYQGQSLAIPLTYFKFMRDAEFEADYF